MFLLRWNLLQHSLQRYKKNIYSDIFQSLLLSYEIIFFLLTFLPSKSFIHVF